MSIESATVRARQRLTAFAYAGVALVLAGIQLAFYLYGYEFDTDLYAHGPLPTLTAILWIAAAAVPFALAWRLPKKDLCNPLKPPPSSLTDFASLLVVASLAGCVAAPLFLKNSGYDPLGQLLASPAASDSTARLMLLASMALAVLGIFHFIGEFLRRPATPAGISAVLLFTAASALRVYFDMRYLLMSPHRVLHLMALIAVMLFLLGELRLARGLASRRLYSALAGIAIIFSFGDALGNLVLSMMGFQTLGSEINTYFFLLTMAIFAFSRLWALSKEPVAKAPTVNATPAVEDAAIETPESDLPTEETADKDIQDDAKEETNEPSPSPEEGVQ